MKEAQQESIVPKIKICGLTSVEEAAWIVEEQVDYAGIVLFYPKSHRNMTIAEAEELLPVIKKGRALSGNPILTVAVTVSPTPEQIGEIQAAGFDRIQVHGELSKESFDAIRIPMIRAFNGFDKEAYEKFHNCEKVEAYLFDAGKPGSGQIFDWDVLRQLPKDEKPIFLAGGLNADNIEQAIREVAPDVVDVSSGVERNVSAIPKEAVSEQKTGSVSAELKRSGSVRVGKDREKIRVFVKAVRRVKALNWREKMNSKYYGEFGGQYVAETLMNTLAELERAFEEAVADPKFWEEYNYYLKEYVGRETPLYYAKRLSEKYGTKMYLKREDLNHTGAHKINNVIGQILLAKRMGKTKLIAETGAGQHGVATATGAALFNMECKVYMGAEDIERQHLNVMRMEMLGTKVVSVQSGSNTLKDATNEAIRTWAKEAEDTFYVLGSAVGPHPYPRMVKEFQKCISVEAKRQFMEKEGRLPEVVMACVGGGSNSIGMFADFIDEPGVELIGVEAAGMGIESGKHASAMALGRPGTLHGMRSYLLQDEDGNVQLAHSISAGLDYPGVGPEHAYLRDSGRAKYVSITDDEAMEALAELCKLEGIIPAIESAHALAYAFKRAETMTKDQAIVLCLSGRGDKDVHTIESYFSGKGYLN